MAVFADQTAFSAGEIAPALYGQVTLAKFHSAASTLRNCFVNYRGGANSRAGTAMCNRSGQLFGIPPRIITFQFSISQGFCLEFGQTYMRVFSNGAPVIESPFGIIGAVQTDPAIITTSVPHGYGPGDWVVIEGVSGMTQLNGNMYIVSSTIGSQAFTISDLNSQPVNATVFGLYTGSGTVARVYTLATPYNAQDLPLLKFTQSADVMSLTHQNYPPYDLARINDTDWTLTEVTLSAKIQPPSSCAAAPTTLPNSSYSPPTLPAAYAYCVTAVDSITGEESVASPIGNLITGVDISQTAGSNIVSWSTVNGSGSYNVYKAPTSFNTQPGSSTQAETVPLGALFGYTATCFGNSFVDSNVVPDFQQTPPVHTNPFAIGQILGVQISNPGDGTYIIANIAITSSTGSGFSGTVVIDNGFCTSIFIQNTGQGYKQTDTATITPIGPGSGATAVITVGPQSGTYPGVVSYFQQRRVYASTENNPDTYYMSKPGLYLNFDTAIPVTDSDSITGTPWAQEVNGIQFMVPMPSGLIVFTGLGAWQVAGAGSSGYVSQPITPSSQQAQPQAFNGCSATVPPVTIDYDILYVQSKGSIVLDMQYSYFENIYTGNDLTELSGHLFTGHTIEEWAWCREPYKTVWAVRDDGVLLSLAYVKQQQVYGWARHDTLGTFVSVCSVTEPPVDALYVVVARPTNASGPGGGQVYYIERMDNRLWEDTEDPWCVDCGLSYPMPEPQAQIGVYPTGPNTATILSDPAVFTNNSVGQIIRACGGIGTITAVQSGSSATCQWVVPPTAYVPNDPNGNLIAQYAGEWTLTTPISVVSGLSYLAGLTVTGLADGFPIPPQVVSAAGTITLPYPATDIKVGLGFTAQIQTPYLYTEGNGTIQGRRKTITAVTARVEASEKLQYGSNQPDGGALIPQQIAPRWTKMFNAPDPEPAYTSPGGAPVVPLGTSDIRIPIGADWAKPGQIAIQQINPLPMNINAVIPEFLEGDLPEMSYAPKQSGDQRGQSNSGPGRWMIS